MLVVGLGSCGGTQQPSASASGPASVSEQPSPSASTASASPVVTPSESPSLITGFDYSDILTVEVNNLAVRAAPERSSPLVQGYRFDNALVPLGEVRLDAGEYVSVNLGPLPIGDTVWYLVWPAVDARLHYSPVIWSTAAGLNGTEPGWVAASVGSDQYLSFFRKADPAEYVLFPPGGPTMLFASGSGDYDSAPQMRYDLHTFNWAAAAGGDGASCGFKVTLVANDASVAPVVVVDTTTTNVAQGLEGLPDPPLGFEDGGTWDSFVVRIESGCTWAIRLEPQPHD